MGIEFGRAVVRLFALGLAFAVLCGGQAGAQTVPPCKTTAGDDGVVFEGTYALIFAPVAFDTVTTEATEIGIVPEVRDGLGVFAGIGKASDAGAVVEFIAGGEAVHQCGVTVVAFDPKQHDLAQMQTGDCELQVVAGRSQLMAEHGQVLEVKGAPEAKADPFRPSSFEASMANPSVTDLSILSGRHLYLLGKTPGVTVLAWIVEEADGFYAINLCPVTVVNPDAVWGAEGPGDEDLCRDVEGAPMRLSVGQTARMSLLDPTGTEASFQEATTAAPWVADFSFEAGGESATVKGLAPGTTSVTLLTFDAAVAANCEVVVE